NSDGAGAANYLGKLTSAEIKALVDAIGDSGLSETIAKLSANFTDLGEGIAKYLVAQATQKQLLGAMMTDEEAAKAKLESANKSLASAFADLGQSVPATTADFRSLIEGLDLTSIAGQETLAKLSGVSESFLVVANAAKAAEREQNSWQLKLDLLQGKYTEKQAQRFFELSAAADESTRAIMQQVYAMEDQASAAQAAAQAQKDAAEAAAQAQAAAAQAAQEAIARASAVKSSAFDAYSNLLTTTGNDAGSRNFALERAQADYSAALDAIASNNNISAAQAQGYIDQHGGMADAASAFWGELGNGTDEATLKNKELLTGLVNSYSAVSAAQNSIAQAQQTEQQKVADVAQQAAEAQARAQQQAAESAQRAAEEQARAQQQTIDGWKHTADSIMSTVRKLTGDMLGEEQSFAKAQADYGIALAAARAGDQTAADRLPELANALVDLGKINSVTTADQALLTARTLAGMRDVVTGIGAKFGVSIPAFAAGGSFSGGLRLVGENGPELEATGPSRIYSSAQTRAMLSGSDSGLLDEVRALRDENRLLRQTMDARLAKIEAHSASTAKATNGNPTAPVPVEAI
ncbi:MAG: hypothetical protein KBE22_13940, partial [Candidatus Accumulibacter sp.]|nr:hypothetical protein [Accumulibacter sp.]